MNASHANPRTRELALDVLSGEAPDKGSSASGVTDAGAHKPSVPATAIMDRGTIYFLDIAKQFHESVPTVPWRTAAKG